MQRTIPDIAELFEPLKSAIREDLIPALIGRTVTDNERRILALTVKLGGMGIFNPVTTADAEFEASALITRNLTEIICRQERDLRNYDKERVSDTIKEIKILKNERQLNCLQEVNDLIDDKMKRILQLSQEKGAGSWLTVIPTKSHGFTLNKREFRDSICLRYGWRVPNTPSYCQCGKKNDVDHTGHLQQNVKNSGFCNFGSPQKNFIPRMCFKHGSTLRKHVQKQKFENIDQELSIAVTYGTYCVTYGTVLS